MGSIIITLPKIEDAKKIALVLERHGMPVDATCHTASETLHNLQNMNNGVVVCGGRLRDMSFVELYDCLPKYFEMIVIASESMIDQCPDNAIRLGMPFKTNDLVRSIELVLEQQERQIKKNKKPPVKRSAEEKECIDKAKQVLMNRNNMTEPEAYRYIQKCSMDSGSSMVETAQMILSLNCDE